MANMHNTSPSLSAQRSAHLISEGCQLLTQIATHLFEQGFQQTQQIEAQFNPTEDDRDHIREHRRLELGFFPQNLVFERRQTDGTGSYIVVERAADYLPRPQGQVTLWEPNSTGRYHRVASKRVADFLYNPSFTAPA